MNSGVTCSGAPATFMITVNPLPIVGCPSDDTICINAPAFPLAGASQMMAITVAQV
ncbi:MAG: hypothetical protein IPL46_29090 [Saprospiraceae bacterium]|nr:hypothetical protein [Saprospiraceae bacterium]